MRKEKESVEVEELDDLLLLQNPIHWIRIPRHALNEPRSEIKTLEAYEYND